ncbi:hypothetical protein ASG88_10620 [Nocardioides sp. Soil777]|uniref:TetR/AcrR family transcriptional regulator n=1 Tax=Nocardioides sp. Soil777 TaxID=1736409 RepID=UPI0007032643|nr:TetR/AcrR family transcriptional regulator [Nocardioides sp. Soil777]KRF00864.1 hypothetical protein ASG88_10620 [Nocardioides sp. Soil777]
MARILDAALEALAIDSEASMAEIARRAGVVRATVYVHFPTRESLIEAVTEHTVLEVTRAVTAAGPDRGDPADALRRVLAAAWRELGRSHALVQINARQSPPDLHRLHRPVFEILEPLIERGQRSGAFRSDVPAAWHLSVVMAIVHTASNELTTGLLPPHTLESALMTTVLGAVGGAHRQ